MPLEDEVEWSWLVRVGKHFKISRVEFGIVFLLLRSREYFYPGLDWPLSELQRQHIANIVGIDVDILTELFPTWGVKPYTELNPFRSYPAYCPKCMSDILPYFRFKWHAEKNTHCEKHNGRLFVSCWTCSKSLQPKDFLHRLSHSSSLRICPHCKSDLGKHPAIPHTLTPLEIADLYPVNTKYGPFTFARNLAWAQNEEMYYSVNVPF